jgi:hypothetical protein
MSLVFWPWEIVRLLREIHREQHRPRPTYVRVEIQVWCYQFHYHRKDHRHMPKQINVGETAVAVITVLDQFGQPITNFDFSANPVSWSVDQPSSVGLAAGAQPDQENCSGIQATSGAATVTGSVLGLSGSDQLTVVGSPVQVPTSVTVAFQ